MKKWLGVTLGILTAIGGFVDIGDLVTNAQVGARFGLSLGWVVILGIIGICVFAEMSGRVAAVSHRATFDLVRERLGPRVGLLNLLGSMAVTLLTFIAEVGGVALAVQLIVSVHHVLLVPLVAVVVWLILWKARFSVMENVLAPTLVAREKNGDAAERARALLEQVGLGARTHHRPAELSGGEKQRAALARALVMRPTLLLCDEPTGNLDQKSAETVASLLLELHRRQETILVVVTHSAELAARFPLRYRLNDRQLERQ